MERGDAQEWRRQRAHAVAAHAAELQRRKEADTAQARELVAAFVAAARELGLRPEPLQAQAYDGRTVYRTGLRGWYLRPDRSIAVGEDREFYLLAVPKSVRARLTGAVVPPHDPPLIVGEGGRDGDRIPLQKLLQLRLNAGEDWP